MKKQDFEERIFEVEIQKIRLNPFQPRRQFSQDELEELALSIQSLGLIHPPVVRLVGEKAFELISGERRFRAAKLAGLKKLPVIVREGSEKLSAQLSLVENIQRVDLSPIEIANAVKKLIQEFGFTQEALAKRVGKKRSTIANYLRLLFLPRLIQDSVASGEITMGHAKAILSLPEERGQRILYERILKENLSVRESEKIAMRLSNKKKKNSRSRQQDFHIYLEELVEKIQRKFGTKVSIQGEGEKGKIIVDYYNLDDLERLLNLWGVVDE